MGPKRSYIFFAIFMTAVLPLTLAVDCFNDINEADFLFGGKKFENVDMEDFVAEKNFLPPLITLKMLLGEFGLPLLPLSAFPLFLPISLTAVKTLRC